MPTGGGFGVQNRGMPIRIRVAARLHCSGDTAWEAAHRPAVAAAVYRPLRLAPTAGELPVRFASGDRVSVSMSIWGLLPAGKQLIAIEDVVPAPGYAGGRMMRDVGRPLSGPLALLRSWRHEITVIPDFQQPQSCLWRDELTIGGAFAPLFAPALWVMWWWRMAKLRRMSRRGELLVERDVP